MAAEKNKERYTVLERELGKVLASRDYGQLKHDVIRADALANYAGLPKHVSVGRSLGLNGSAVAELDKVYERVMAPINMRMFAIIKTVEALHLLRDRGAAKDDEKSHLEAARSAFGASLVAQLSESFREEGLDNRPNVRACVVYPLVIAVLNTRRKYDNEFAGSLIQAIMDQEKDPKLKAYIHEIDSPKKAQGPDTEVFRAA